MTTLAVLAAVCAAALVVAPPSRLRPSPGRAARQVGPWTISVVVAAVLLCWFGLRVGPMAAYLVALTAGTLSAIIALWRRGVRRREADQISGRVAETCSLIADELHAGRPVAVALDCAADEWSLLVEARRAFELGADVPDALRRLATVPGAADLRLLGAAWQVSAHTGHGLAVAVDSVAGNLRAAQSTRRVIASELASARATAWLVAALPIPALLIGGGAGGNPWRFLIGTPIGLGLLTGGLVLGLAGLWWLELIADGARGSW
jgi:tight adherence protein B